MDLGQLGRTVQRLRIERQMTLQQLAQASAVSVSMLSAVERGGKAPTVVVLDRIAGGLGTTAARLLADSDERIIVRRAAEQDEVTEPGGWRRTVLSPVVPGVNFEWIRSTLPAGCEPDGYPPYAPGSHEFIAVESGRLTLTVGDRILELDPGDSAYLAGDQQVGYANHGKQDCSYVVAALVMRPRTAGLRWRPAPSAGSSDASSPVSRATE